MAFKLMRGAIVPYKTAPSNNGSSVVILGRVISRDEVRDTLSSISDRDDGTPPDPDVERKRRRRESKEALASMRLSAQAVAG